MPCLKRQAPVLSGDTLPGPRAPTGINAEQQVCSGLGASSPRQAGSLRSRAYLEDMPGMGRLVSTTGFNAKQQVSSGLGALGPRRAGSLTWWTCQGWGSRCPPRALTLSSRRARASGPRAHGRREALPGGRAGDGAAGVHQDAPAVACGRMALHRLVEAAVGALGNDHVVVLGLPGLLQGRLLLLVARGHCSEEETGVSGWETGRGWPAGSPRCCGGRVDTFHRGSDVPGVPRPWMGPGPQQQPRPSALGPQMEGGAGRHPVQGH